MGVELHTNPDVTILFSQYPDHVRRRMEELRDLVLESANETADVDEVEETLKWGEPSYLTKFGSTIRMDWKSKTPDRYALYFKCTSRLVETFRLSFGDIFHYERNRAIVFKLDEKVPRKELKACIRAALIYHKVKHLPTLGI